MKYLLGLDEGGTITKAAIYSLDGKEIATSSIRTNLSLTKEGFAERDMEELWLANIEAIKLVLQKSQINAADVAALAITGHGNGLYLTDKTGRGVYPGIYSTDIRAQSYIDKWYQDGTFERVLPKIKQSMWSGQPIAILAWLRDNKPEVLLQTRWIFMCKDYIRFRLTGEAMAETTDISGTSLLNIDQCCYDPELLEQYGLELISDKLPPLTESASVCGRISLECSKLTGLKENTPVAGGLFDIDACAIATGITDPKQMNIVAGTWSINQYISSNPVTSSNIFMTSLYCIPGFWLVLEGSATSASNLEWFISEFLDTDNPDIYQSAEKMVQSVGPEEDQIIFHPFLYGSNLNHLARSSFIGIKGWHKKEHLLRAVFEGIVFSHRYHIEKLFSFRSHPEEIRMAGGAAKSKVWIQMFADILQIPIVITKAEELGTLGAAICAGAGVGLFTDFKDATDKMVHIKDTFYPNPDLKKIYDQKYKRYLLAAQSLDKFWE